MRELKRIIAPIKYRYNLDKMLQPDSQELIISCQNKRKNFYQTTNYRRWMDSNLASISWRHALKSDSDHFTINPVSKLPAWRNSDSFSHLGLCSEVIDVLQQNKFIRTTCIQALVIPTISNGHNTIIGGETGCGKSLAFLIPIVNRIFTTLRDKDDSLSPAAIILAPTWELCEQLAKVAQVFTSLGVKSTTLLQKNLCKSDILISTPFSLLSFIESGQIEMKNLLSVVFDEADMLFDPSFAENAQRLLQHASIQTTAPISGHSVGAQLVLCNATTPHIIEETFGSLVPLDSFRFINTDTAGSLLQSVAHKFFRVSKNKKPVILLSLLKRGHTGKIPFTLIFCNTNDSLEELSQLLEENGVEHVCLHKNLKLNSRQVNFDRFQNGDARVLLCSDLGSRGLDTRNAVHVINYEFPRHVADYVHRAGRVGRVGSQGVGKVTSLISRNSEVATVQIIEMSVRLRQKLPNVDARKEPLGKFVNI